MPFSGTRSGEILDELRKRICLWTDGERLVLRETALAEEFNVSRTPIRQILQELAVEGMVEVQPGVGSVATALETQDRELELKVLGQCALAAAACAENGRIPHETRTGLTMIEARLAQSDVDAETYAAIYADLINALCGVVTHHVTFVSLKFSLWRTARWRLRDFQGDPQGTWTLTTQYVAMLRASQQFDSAALMLRTIATLAENMSPQITRMTSLPTESM